MGRIWRFLTSRQRQPRSAKVDRSETLPSLLELEKEEQKKFRDVVDKVIASTPEIVTPVESTRFNPLLKTREEGLRLYTDAAGALNISSVNKKIIEALEERAKEEPHEWIYPYMLGDFCNRQHEFDKALVACKKALELKPNDPRSTYGLATCFRKLSEAKFASPEYREKMELAKRYQLQYLGEDLHGDFIDPEASQDAMSKSGIAIDEAAEQSLYYFEKTLQLGVRKKEKFVVTDSLAVMYKQFPHLKERVKDRLKEVS